ncbi:Kojibiose phosphorylase [subsurface metagenome]
MSVKPLLHKNWVICEDGISREKMRFQETIFALGNGYIGARGTLEEGYREECAGTYIAGIYDRGKGQSSEIVNVPNPFRVEIYINGKKLSMDNMKVVEHRRILDMKKAVLSRHTVFADAGKRYEYQSRRFLSLRDMHLGVMRFSFRALDGDAHVVVKRTIDGTTRNEIQAVGEPIKHYAVTHATDTGGGVLYLEARTNDPGILIGVASSGDVETGKFQPAVETKCYTNGESVVRESCFDARKGRRYRFNEYISIYTSHDFEHDVKSACLNGVELARKQGIARLLRKHVRAWDRRWQNCDIGIEGDLPAQKAIRFNIYHMLIAASSEDMDVSIGAKALSGEWYKGHVFWDTEIYILPFFIYTQPEIAKNLLLYRYRRLSQARIKAKLQKYKGALFPWESAASGKDETPQWWKGPDGRIIKVYTKQIQHHIVSDIAYAVATYYRVTNDDKFMLHYGAELIFETARFWASRASYNENLSLYEVKEVTGPDEYHKGVDNSSYTNYLARWNLLYAAELYNRFCETHPDQLKKLSKRISLSQNEVEKWRDIGNKIMFLIGENGLIEEFQGYFGKRNEVIEQWDEKGMPIYSKDEAKLKHTQLVKQADVILLLHLFPDDFTRDIRKMNFGYYEARTTHLSSLSPCIHAILAAELDAIDKAYKYFRYAVNGDLEDYFGNTELGIHAASLGGIWQLMINGFAGVRVKEDILSINPRLPRNWQSLEFKLIWRGGYISFRVSGDKVEVFLSSRNKKIKLPISIYNKACYIGAGKLTTVAK